MDTRIRTIPQDLDMAPRVNNPFDITKAVDFTDKQILDLWVDLTDGSGFSLLVKPTSPMPMIIEGGKGSGKTHLMRYLTLTSQLLRSNNNVEALLNEDGYIGIYVRFSGLNASRFRGKGHSPEVWSDVFAYYSELWFGQLLLKSVHCLADLSPKLDRDLNEIGGTLVALLTKQPVKEVVTLKDFLSMLEREQREVDNAINNCALSQSLNVSITMNRGALIFNGCEAIASASSLLRDIVFVFLLDEYENLEVAQQTYVNTLIREKRPPANFKVGTRSYGIRTYSTLSSGESLVEGSEFSLLRLDEQLRAKRKPYENFCRQMICRRLNDAAVMSPSDVPVFAPKDLGNFFWFPDSDYYLRSQTQFVIDKYKNRERPYFGNLRRQLSSYAPREGRKRQYAVRMDEIISNLEASEFPLVEKVHLLLFYRGWARGEPLLEWSRKIRSLYDSFCKDQDDDSSYRKVLEKFKGDLFAQLLRQCDQKQRYVGWKNFVAMSAGLPRNLLVLLKHIHAWAEFEGEKPFAVAPISKDTQTRGVMDAARWFFENARIPGEIGQRARAGVERLAELFRAVRFADKPSECSLVTFSVNLGEVDSIAKESILICEKWSLLIRVPLGQKDKNSSRVDAKYQLSPMLAPLWELPVARRGAIALSPQEAHAIFGEESPDLFKRVLRYRLAPMNAPFDKEVFTEDQVEIGFDEN